MTSSRRSPLHGRVAPRRASRHMTTLEGLPGVLPLEGGASRAPPGATPLRGQDARRVRHKTASDGREKGKDKVVVSREIGM